MNNYMKSNKAPIFGISRHRIGTDGYGIKTLVTFMGCPLKCKYCINDVCHLPLPAEGYGIEWLSPQELYDRVKIDNLYFLATYGGITFGGGEPGLYADYIKEFKSICHKEWKLTLQTSLNYPQKYLEELLLVIDEFIVDVKDMNPDIYKAYTGVNNEQVINNLLHLKKYSKTKNITILVPKIPNYTTNWWNSSAELGKLGICGLIPYTYKEYIIPDKMRKENQEIIGTIGPSTFPGHISANYIRHEVRKESL